MHRFFVGRENIAGDGVVFPKGEAEHIRRVLRLKAGDAVHVLDGEGMRYRVRLTDVDREEVRGAVLHREGYDSESPVAVHLGQCLLKGQAMDGVVRRAVELGAASITPVVAARCQVPLKSAGGKIGRWREIARAAAKQSGRSKIPPVHEAAAGLPAFCEHHAHADLKLIFWEEEATARLGDLRPAGVPANAALLIGPEGGFEAAEVAAARGFGFLPVGLGPRILRAETAPLVALALVQALWGDL